VVAKPNIDDSPEGKAIILARKKRQERLDAWNDYISFGVNKVAGLGGIVGGAADLMDPTLIPQLHHPQYVLGAGLALLGGKSVIKLVDAVVKALT
jgi:hypothetical protein